jgi:hypothetical protein
MIAVIQKCNERRVEWVACPDKRIVDPIAGTAAPNRRQKIIERV